VGQSVAAKDPSTGHVVAEAEGLRAELYKKLNQLTGKNAAAIKKRYGALASMEDSMLRRKIVADRQQPTSLSEQIGRWAGAGKLVKGNFHGSLAEAASGIAEAGAAKWLKEQQTTDALIEKAFANYGKRQRRKHRCRLVQRLLWVFSRAGVHRCLSETPSKQRQAQGKRAPAKPTLATW